MLKEVEKILAQLDEKDQLIIACARKEFAQYGYYNANMDRIATVANLGKGTIYRRFTNKQVLFFVTIEVGQRALFERLEQVDMALPFRELFENSINAVIDYLDSDYDLLRLSLHEHSKVMEGIKSSELEEMIFSLHLFQTNLWLDILKQAVEQGYLLPESNLDLLASVLSNIMRSVFSELVVFSGGRDPSREVITERGQLLTKILFEGVFREPNA